MSSRPRVSEVRAPAATVTDNIEDASVNLEIPAHEVASSGEKSSASEGITAKGVKSKNQSLTRTSVVAWSRRYWPPLHHYYDSCLPEVGAIITSMIAAIAIAVILGVYGGKASPDVALGLTLNSIISILATTSRVSLVYSVSNSLGQAKWLWFKHSLPRSVQDMETFDNASRGPLGALGLLWGRPCGYFTSLGAMVITLTLIFDPFVQQVVRFNSRLVFIPSDQVSTVQANFLAVDGPVRTTTRAVNSAFWRDDFSLKTVCPSGNCTFPLFTSVA